MNINFIGDIHGRRQELEALLSHLGYSTQNGIWRNLTNCKTIFIGDLIDRGPDIPGALSLVKGMADAGECEVLQGNHEFNLLCHYTPDDNGGYLRPHTKNKIRGSAESRDFLDANPLLRTEYITWFKTFPMVLNFGSVRCVHACWSEAALNQLNGRFLLDQLNFGPKYDRNSDDGEAVERLLKGPETRLPKGIAVQDRDGSRRKDMRVAWWKPLEGQTTYKDLAIKDEELVPNEKVDGHDLESWDAKAPLTIIGHYSLPAGSGHCAANVACIDYSSQFGIGAYCWKGEAQVNPNHFVQ